MNKASVEVTVGVFVLIGIICITYMSVRFGKMEWVGDNHYTLTARFASVSGLKPGAEVQIAGVQVGKVDAISLDPEEQVAVVALKLSKEVTVTDDVIASVKTAGLIGDKFIKLTPGGSDELLQPGGMIEETESALDIEELVSKYVFGGT